MLVVRSGADRAVDQLPAVLVIERTSNRFCDESTPPTASDTGIQPADVSLVQGYVHTHGHNVAHRLPATSTHARVRVQTRPGLRPEEREHGQHSAVLVRAFL